MINTMIRKRKILLIDLDDTANMFSEELHKKMIEQDPNIKNYPLNLRTLYEIENYYPKESTANIINIVGAQGFILNLPPKQDFVEIVNKLQNIYIIYFCSSPTKINPELSSYEKHQWLKKYFGSSDNLILTRDKTVIYGDFLIDDKPYIEGNINPSWERIMFDQPYNKSIDCKLRFDNWIEIYDFLSQNS